MGDDQGQSGLAEFVLFLDENHCRNPHVINAIEERSIVCEKHLDHFAPGSEDTDWLPVIAQRGWSLLTTDANSPRIVGEGSDPNKWNAYVLLLQK